jgi:hypothetical protein
MAKMNNKYLKILYQLKNQKGISVILVSISIIALLGFTAIAIDLGHRHVVQNELQNAADAGALAGAAALYKNTLGVSVDPMANTDAYTVATANTSQGVAVDLYNYDGITNNSCAYEYADLSDPNYEDVMRGHWAFANPSADDPYKVAAKYFKCNGSTAAVNVANYTLDQLNSDNNFINAVKVVTRREGRATGTPTLSFFAKIFGYESFDLRAQAIAYIGFASEEVEAGAPIAICESEILGYPDGPLTCNIGRMFNANNDTARWTLLESCTDSTDWSYIKDLAAAVCDDSINFNVNSNDLRTKEGQQNSAFDELTDCWSSNATNDITLHGVDQDDDGKDDTFPVPIDRDTDGFPDQPFSLTLPVILCTEGPTCGPLRGFVEVSVIWMADKDFVDGGSGELGAPNKMSYSIPEFDGTLSDPPGMDYGDAWPDVPNAAPYDLTTPISEPISGFCDGNTGGSFGCTDAVGDDTSLYDILQTFTNFENRIEKPILQDHPELENPVDWDKTYPYWTTQTLEQLFDYGAVRWASLVKHFNLKDKGSINFADYEQKTIYFLPTCKPVDPDGKGGNQNFGILARIPVLVK